MTFYCQVKLSCLLIYLSTYLYQYELICSYFIQWNVINCCHYSDAPNSSRFSQWEHHGWLLCHFDISLSFFENVPVFGTRCSRFIIYFPFLFSGISHFSKELLCTRCGMLGVLIAAGVLTTSLTHHWTELGTVSVHKYTSKCFCVCMYIRYIDTSFYLSFIWQKLGVHVDTPNYNPTLMFYPSLSPFCMFTSLL